MERVLYMAQDDHCYAGKTAKEIMERKMDRAIFMNARNVDHYVQLVVRNVRGGSLPTFKELGKTTEERCEYLLKLLTKLKVAAVVKGGSKDDKKLSFLLRQKRTFVACVQIYEPPEKL